LGELSLPGVCYNQLKDFKVHFHGTMVLKANIEL